MKFSTKVALAVTAAYSVSRTLAGNLRGLPEVVPKPDGCGTFIGCHLYNTYELEDIKELYEGVTIIYNLDVADGFSIRCELEGNFNFVKFTYPGGEFIDWAAPHFMNGDSDGAMWVVPVEVLETEGQKEITVSGDIWTGNCFTNTYIIEPGMTLPPTDPETSSPTTLAPVTSTPTTSAPTTASPVTDSPTTAAPTTAAPTTVAPVTTSPTTAAPTTASPTTAAPVTAPPTTAAPTTAAPVTSAPTRSPTDPVDDSNARTEPTKPAEGCGTFIGCHLYNTYELEDIKELYEGETIIYNLDVADGFSIRCELEGNFNFVKFTYPGGEFIDWAAPHFMNGDSDGAMWVVPVEVLETEGPKEINVSGDIWTGNCFKKTYTIEPGMTPPPTDPETEAPTTSPTHVEISEIKCEDDRKEVSGYCVKDWCKEDFQCPDHSTRKMFYGDELRYCFDSIGDCQCDDGYHLDGDECIEDGQCESGRKEVSGYCVKDWCEEDFQCPDHSTRKIFYGNELRYCFDTIEDCECDNGYYMDGDECVEEGQCGPGRKEVSGFCVMDWCEEDFQCPDHSTRKIFSGDELRHCFDSIGDCQCINGYRMQNEYCVCGHGYKEVSGYCVKEWCDYDYQCPEGMERKPSRECYNNNDDCRWRN